MITKSKKFGKSSDDGQLLSDIDCLSINVKLLLFWDSSQERPFVYLLNYIIDVENMVGFVGGV